MELNRFRRLLDAYGADMRRWPAAERRPAQALLAASVDARCAHAETAALDDRLRAAHPAVSEASVQRVLGTLATLSRDGGTAAQHVDTRQHRARDRAWASTAILAGMAALGLAIGLVDFDMVTGPADFVDAIFDTDLLRGLDW